MVKKLETFVPAFKSANDPFLTKMSIVMEKMSECRTYIAFDRETSKIMGFFSYVSDTVPLLLRGC